MAQPLIWIERSDYLRLLSVRAEACALLGRELERAIVLAAADMPAAVIRVGDRVCYRLDDGAACWADLILQAAATGADAVSVTSSLGAALVGLRAGSAIDYLDDQGRPRRLFVERVVSAGSAPP